MINKIVIWSSKQLNLNDKEIITFKYGFALLLNMLINFLLVIMIGILWGYFFESILFFISYVFIKRDTGGYHAKSHFSCISQFNFVFFILIAYYHFVIITELFMYVICIITIITTFLFAPIVSPQKHIPTKEIILHKYRSRIKIIFLCGFWYLGNTMFHNTYTDFVFLGIFMLWVTLLLGVIEQNF